MVTSRGGKLGLEEAGVMIDELTRASGRKAGKTARGGASIWPLTRW